MRPGLAMRTRWYIALFYLGACTQEVGGNACQIGMELYGEAMADAEQASVPCERDVDCTLLQATVTCPAIRIRSCPSAVHRRVEEAYWASGVQKRICRATRDAELGCDVGPACTAVERVACIDGECVGATSL